MEEENNQSYRRPRMTVQARDKEEDEMCVFILVFLFLPSILSFGSAAWAFSFPVVHVFLFVQSAAEYHN